MRGERRPTYLLVTRIMLALEQQLGRKIDPRDVITEDPEYDTMFVCDLVGCKGCLPEWFYDDAGDVKPEYSGIPPGQWTQPGRPEDLET